MPQMGPRMRRCPSSGLLLKATNPRSGCRTQWYPSAGQGWNDASPGNQLISLLTAYTRYSEPCPACIVACTERGKF